MPGTGGPEELYLAPHTTQRLTRLIAGDPESGEVLASQVMDQQWIGFIGQGIAFSWDVDEYSVPYIDRWRPRLVSEPVDP